MAGPDSTSESLDPEQIERMVDDALGAIAAAADSAQLKAVRQTHAADRSPLALANHSIGSMPKERRKDAGRLIGRARGRVNEALAARAAELEAAELAARLEAERVDVTLPVVEHPVGAEHPLTALINRMCDVFVAMGWEVVEGPELEAEWLNFDALNFTPDHPARFMSDTLFVDPPSGHTIMRTQTSPVQVRTLLDRALPVYVVSPGKVFRADEYDATHLPVFHQLEGLAVDRGITMGDLKGTLDHLAKAMFGDIRTRLRPHYFPFTEPSAEVDLECFVCHGSSVGDPERPCRACRSEGWIEWGGCGVVNPRVLVAAGIDPNVYSGFAFGMGVDRTVMFRNNAPDLRDFVEGDVRFSRSLVGGAR
ncbi:phenylalanine--tRNA ligase, alpha subunit [Propionibacterium acidifaciens F0233]|uniref:Phenylalanine--tRNA ligase alpha subunit n=1 Tax=Propionibacterium acidifaciens F0233 TaxID=553198 RepID=U2SCL6_9ACTN|nr:phenylalanine--tRNA ligase subunit alpha [Propionibacterium acidifaciens]AYW77019.1 phenylalanine--tRNA ligase subunit alpha [Propionibacterium acidifaciens]ERK63323.1 phenylalanine--tRNA ligase, alpha subunit [Propionibacterium acidifaciens F0233]